MDNNRIIRLNFGGQVFATSRETLLIQPNTFFTKLLDGTIPTTIDNTGAFFIDRNGKHFEPILDYLRTSIFCVPNGTSVRHVEELASFLGIKLPKPKPIEYRVVYDDYGGPDTPRIEQQANALIEEGFVPLGGVAAATVGDFGCRFYQAFVEGNQ